MTTDEIMHSKPVDVLVNINNDLQMIKHDMVKIKDLQTTILAQNREIMILKETVKELTLDVNKLIVKEERNYGNTNRTCQGDF